jgi:hypothetical protein
MFAVTAGYPQRIADKICALYEVHGAAGAASGRFRDPVDVLLISMLLPIDLASTVDAVERERRVRGLPALPATVASPGPAWVTQWCNARPQQSTHRGPARPRERAGCRGPLLQPHPRLATHCPAAGGVESSAHNLGLGTEFRIEYASHRASEEGGSQRHQFRQED